MLAGWLYLAGHAPADHLVTKRYQMGLHYGGKKIQAGWLAGGCWLLAGWLWLRAGWLRAAGGLLTLL